MPDSIAIVSGGMDSITLLHYLLKVGKRTPALITFRYGQKHAKEVDFAESQAKLLGCRDHLVLELSSLAPLFAESALVSAAKEIPTADDVAGDPQPATYVPNRNMIFIALAAAYAETRGVSDLYYGAQRHDLYGYWDTTPRFLEQFNQLFRLNRKTQIQIHAPFVQLSKADILRQGVALEVDYSQTWSCYEGSRLACGRCPTCAERLSAFAEIGLRDPLPYVDDADQSS